MTDRWRVLAPSPLAGRFYHGVVWTGSEMVVWGGAAGDGAESSRFDDGAAWDPATDRWRAVTDTPFLSARDGAVLAWTGSEVLVWGGTEEGPQPTSSGAAWDPVSGTWRQLASAPADMGFTTGAAWTGEDLYVLGDRGLRYRAAADRWEVLPATALDPLYEAALTWTGQDLLVWEGIGADGVSTVTGAAFRPDGRATVGLGPYGPRPTITAGYLPAGWDRQLRPGAGGGIGVPALGHWKGMTGTHLTVFRDQTAAVVEESEPVTGFGRPGVLETIETGFRIRVDLGPEAGPCPAYTLYAYGLDEGELRRVAEGLTLAQG